jgi:hypothetical protein
MRLCLTQSRLLIGSSFIKTTQELIEEEEATDVKTKNIWWVEDAYTKRGLSQLSNVASSERGKYDEAISVHRNVCKQSCIIPSTPNTAFAHPVILSNRFPNSSDQCTTCRYTMTNSEGKNMWVHIVGLEKHDSLTIEVESLILGKKQLNQQYKRWTVCQWESVME